MSSSRAIVVLIGGAPGVGKSTLGRALAARLGYAALTGDDLLVAAQAVTTEVSHPALHQVRSVGHVAYFTDGAVEKLVSDALAQEEAMWPVFERVVRSHVASRSPVVVDWWLLRPKTVADLGEESVLSLWLQLDPGALWDRERANSDWMKSSADADRMLDNFMHRSLWRNDLVASEAKYLGLSVLDLYGGESVDVLVEWAMEALELGE